MGNNLFANKTKTNEENAEADAKQVESSEPGVVDFVSRPVSRMRVGRFQFENGRLQCTAEEAEQLEAMVQKIGGRTAQIVRRIDRNRAEQIAREFVKQNQPTMTQGGDTSTNGAPPPEPQQHAE